MLESIAHIISELCFKNRYFKDIIVIEGSKKEDRRQKRKVKESMIGTKIYCIFKSKELSRSGLSFTY